MDIKFDEFDIAEVKKMLFGIEEQAPRIISTSINISIRNTKTFATKEIGKRYNLKAARIKKDFREEKATLYSLSGRIDVSGENIGLAQFGAKLKRGEVSVKVRRSGGRKVVRGTFLANAKGARHIFGRTRITPTHLGGQGIPSGPKKNINYAKLPEHYRRPVTRRIGPSVPDMMAHDSIINKVEEKANERMLINLDYQIERALQRV